MATEISVLCRAGAGLAPENADTICSEFLAVLRDTYPDRTFHPGGAGNPRAEFTVTQANERSVGLTVTWISGTGAATDGLPLQASFYDRPASPARRKSFYTAFLNQNPLPF